MPNILIVDDQPHIGELLSEELSDEGYRTVSVSDADSVKAHLEKTRPDLVLLDLYLRGFEGWNLLHDIKVHYPRVPVLILTAYDSFKDDPRVVQADGYLLKSLNDLDELKRKIAEILG